MRGASLMLAGRVFVVLLIAAFVLAVGCVSSGEPEAAKTTIRGIFTTTKGCGGVVNGTLIEHFFNKCEEAAQYENRTVEVVGYVSYEECPPGTQCFGGPTMVEIESIRIIEE